MNFIPTDAAPAKAGLSEALDGLDRRFIRRDGSAPSHRERMDLPTDLQRRLRAGHAAGRILLEDAAKRKAAPVGAADEGREASRSPHLRDGSA